MARKITEHQFDTPRGLCTINMLVDEGPTSNSFIAETRIIINKETVRYPRLYGTDCNALLRRARNAAMNLDPKLAKPHYMFSSWDKRPELMKKIVVVDGNIYEWKPDDHMWYSHHVYGDGQWAKATTSPQGKAIASRLAAIAAKEKEIVNLKDQIEKLEGEMIGFIKKG